MHSDASQLLTFRSPAGAVKGSPVGNVCDCGVIAVAATFTLDCWLMPRSGHRRVPAGFVKQIPPAEADVGTGRRAAA